MRDPAITEFINRANEVSVTEAARLLGIKVLNGDRGQRCPVCGGKDRFSINAEKEAWYCRGSEIGGRTGISLVGYVSDLDLHKLPDLLEACSIALDGAAKPELGRQETEEEKAERVERLARLADRRQRRETEKQEQNDAHRDREVRKARGIYLNAMRVPHEGDRVLRDYLRLRSGFEMASGVFDSIRFVPNCTYWHRMDERGNPISHHVGPAMIAPIVDLEGHVVGCHQTWIDLSRAPKYRPDLGLDEKGDPLATKKMRGLKKGYLIPVCGDMSAVRWLGGEGIENVAAVAGFERFRDDTFYFAAGDLGNLAGPADRSAGRSEAVVDASGKKIRVHPFPRQDQLPTDGVQVADHVSALILLADGDSEFYFTAAAMARAKARQARDGREIAIWWPPQGTDWAKLLSEKA